MPTMAVLTVGILIYYDVWAEFMKTQNPINLLKNTTTCFSIHIVLWADAESVAFNTGSPAGDHQKPSYHYR